ncbi:DNA polymerase III subunit gamma/tau [bacterium]|nr:DNA polymerase III subunit gamma/tau [bacterium]
MEHVSIYRKFRPNTFDKVIGQEHIVRTLTNQIESGRVGHAYLFTGTRGTGKTSCAKIFARAVNCLSPKNGSPCGECEVCKALSLGSNIDIIEIDAASNNGVDEIRELKENAQYRPTTCKYKVYIIDEVHMLTASAFNALLKTLEEPPQHIIFILATTEVHKLPQTILSRCMRFDFRLVGLKELINLLKEIFDTLNVKFEEDALKQMALHGEGSVRDTLSIADMCMSYSGSFISYKDTLEVLCATNFDTLDELGGAILDGNVAKALKLTDSLLSHGRNTLSKDLANYFMNLITVKNIENYKGDTLSEHESDVLNQRAKKYENYRISRAMDIMASMENQVRFSTQPKILIEANIVRACELNTELNLDGLTNRINELEKKLNQIEKNGIVLEKTVERENAMEENMREEEESNNLLAEMATPVEEELIFEETSEIDDKSFLANEVWQKVINKLSEMGEMTLNMAASYIDEGLSIINREFIVSTEDKVNLTIFNKEDNSKVMNKIIKEILGEGYSFVCRPSAPFANAISADDKITLKKMFNGAVKFKK